jgi:hypothetical protein
VIDLDDDGPAIDVIEGEGASQRMVAALVDKMVVAITMTPDGYLTKTQLRDTVGGGRLTQDGAFDLLVADPRVNYTEARVRTKDGKVRKSKVWRPARIDQPSL